ncbi:MAG: hypothetical protein QOG27_1243, partial [Verrucomicrobiota bacterium]
MKQNRERLQSVQFHLAVIAAGNVLMVFLIASRNVELYRKPNGKVV